MHLDHYDLLNLNVLWLLLAVWFHPTSFLPATRQLFLNARASKVGAHHGVRLTISKRWPLLSSRLAKIGTLSICIVRIVCECGQASHRFTLSVSSCVRLILVTLLALAFIELLAQSVVLLGHICLLI